MDLLILSWDIYTCSNWVGHKWVSQKYGNLKAGWSERSWTHSMFCSIASFRMYYPKWEITATDEIICTKYVGSCKVLETSPLLLELTALFWPKSLDGRIWEEDWDSITLFGIYKVNAVKVKKKKKRKMRQEILMYYHADH